jgi:hypothetical protein
MWRNWQTRGIQNPVGFTPGEGSTPSFGIVSLGGFVNTFALFESSIAVKRLKKHTRFDSFVSLSGNF